MYSVSRRRGGQPGNTNALKHGLYRDKPAPGQRPKGAQPGNLNSLSHGKYISLIQPFQPPAVPLPPQVSQEFSNPTRRPGRPRKTPPLVARQPVVRPSRVRLSASLARLFALLELQLLDLLDRPFCLPSQPFQELYRLNAELIRQLRNLPDPSPNPLDPTERNLQ
jgi:hypothetical protein